MPPPMLPLSIIPLLHVANSSCAPPLPTPMEKIEVNVVPYLPLGMTIKLGLEDRVVQSDMVVHLVPPLNHDFLTIAEVNHHVPFHKKEAP